MDELCPNGVKFIELRDLFYTRNGYTPSKSKPEFWENGNIPWFRMEDIRENGRILSDSFQHVTPQAIKGSLFPAGSIIVATSATIGEHALILVDSLANQRFTYLTLKKEYANCFEMKFLFYYCFKLDEYCLANLNQGNFASVDMDKFAKFKFPILPLPIQAEIIRILDTFTELTDKLNAELLVRRTQYEYYRDLLLSFDNADETNNDTVRSTPPRWEKLEIKWMRLGDIVYSISSGQNKWKFLVGKYPVYGSTGIIGRTDKEAHHGTKILIARVGVNAGYAQVASGSYDVSDNTLVIDVRDKYDVRYVYYQLCKSNLHRYAKGGGQPLVTAGEIKKVKIPVPPLAEQRRIVEILDRFDALCNDLTAGLPAEIEARRKQYEHYRDKLLSFKELET